MCLLQYSYKEIQTGTGGLVFVCLLQYNKEIQPVCRLCNELTFVGHAEDCVCVFCSAPVELASHITKAVGVVV